MDQNYFNATAYKTRYTKCMNTTFFGNFLSDHDNYSIIERQIVQSIVTQVKNKFANGTNLVLNLTWFGLQFDNDSWINFEQLVQKMQFDRLFFVALVDPSYLNVTELQQVKNMAQSLEVYYIGNFDSPHGFNFFAPILKNNFKHYTTEQLTLINPTKIYVNYNRKPRKHRVEFVERLAESNLLDLGTVTLGKGNHNYHMTIGEKQEDYIAVGTQEMQHWGLPSDYYSLHRLDIWQNTFLYINGATENNPVNDLFCQQDTFKPIIGLRPFVINGVQKTYRWLRLHGFKTFNHYWPHINLETCHTDDIHKNICEVIVWLQTQDLEQLYLDMLPDLHYNKLRFDEFALEQKYKMENLFA